MQGIQGIVKRLIDIVFSLFALTLLSPLMLAIAVAIRLTSPGKVIFRQERVGRAGKRFNIYKFRSMHADAEAKVGHVWAKDDDPRETSLGKFLRRWSLDELAPILQRPQRGYESRWTATRDVRTHRHIPRIHTPLSCPTTRQVGYDGLGTSERLAGQYLP